MCSHPQARLSRVTLQALLVKKCLVDIIGTQQSRVHVKPLYNTSIKILSSPLCKLYLQKVLLIHSRKLNVYATYYITQNCLCVSPSRVQTPTDRVGSLIVR